MKQLRVATDGRTLEYSDGSPFFYLGDTAWTLAHRLDRIETEDYLKARAAQGFNAIQFCAISEFGGLVTPNRQGDFVLKGNDPAQPNEGYFTHIDLIVRRANELGMFAALLPTWADKVNRGSGEGPEIFTPENAAVYGRWLATRYKSDGMIWVLGGDRTVETERHLAIWRAMADGIRAVVGRSHLITFHPNGGCSSSKYVHNENWVDFHMMQSGHTGRDLPNWQMVHNDRMLQPPKPTLDGEPCYEEHPIMMMADGRWVHDSGFFGAHDVRKSLYRSMLAGACGYTYGCHAMWQFFDPARNPAVNKPVRPWRESLGLAGAEQLRHGLALWKLLLQHGPIEPNQGVLVDQMHPGNRQMVAVQAGKSAVAIYSPVRQNILVAIKRLPFAVGKASWFNPRTGAVKPAEVTSLTAFNLQATATDDDDYVLTLEQ